MRAGEIVTFTNTDNDVGERRVPVDFPDFPRLVSERSGIVVGDGVPRLVVESVGPGEVVARSVSAGELAPRKGINVTYARPELPAITDKDVGDLALAANLGADLVALSFVRSAAELEQLRARLGVRLQGRTIAKIEKIEGYEHVDEIIAAADGVMVARGDYGVEAGVAWVPLMQKDTIRRATEAGKLVITATQMLESMIRAPEPTRAEATDVASAAIDGTSAVMLSAETRVGQHPVEAVRAMSQLAEAAETPFDAKSSSAIGTKLKHKSVLIRCRLSGNASGMANLAQKIEAEKRMRDLLEDSGLPQPDRVEYGFTCIRLFFESVRQVVIIDIDEPEDPESAVDTDAA